MSKEKVYIQNKNIYEVNENNVSSYIRALISVLRRYKEKDNTDKIEKAIFEVKELNNIPLNENLENLGKIITEETLREIKEEPFVIKIKLPQQRNSSKN